MLEFIGTWTLDPSRKSPLAIVCWDLVTHNNELWGGYLHMSSLEQRLQQLAKDMRSSDNMLGK
jgi:hypothetical protein